MILSKYILPDGSYDLAAALKDACPHAKSAKLKQALDFIERTEELLKIQRASIKEHTLRVAINIATAK